MQISYLVESNMMGLQVNRVGELLKRNLMKMVYRIVVEYKVRVWVGVKAKN